MQLFEGAVKNSGAMSAWYNCDTTPPLNSRYNSAIYMFIWDHYLHVIVYISTIALTTSDVVIKFYFITFPPRELIQSENLEEETSPTPEEISEMEENPLVLLSGEIRFVIVKARTTQSWMDNFHRPTVRSIGSG